MKKSILFIILSIPFFCNSQNEKGTFFLETGVTLFGGGDYNAFIGKTGISFWQTALTVERQNNENKKYPPYNDWSYSIAPRFGYFLNNKIAIGLDFQYYKHQYIYKRVDDKEDYKNLLSGIFLRHYFLNKKITPFIELSSGIGISKNVEEYLTHGGGNVDKIKYFNILYFSGALGYSFVLSPRFNLGISAIIQNTVEKPNDKGNVSTDVAKISTLESGLVMSISYHFNKNNNKEE